MQKTLWMVGFLSALAMCGAHAGAITNTKYAYSLEFGRGWKLDRKQRQFSVSHPDGSSFTGMQPDTSGAVKSVKVASQTVQFTALAAGFCGQGATEFELAGPGWTGHGFHCNNRPNDKGPAGQTIGFAAKRGAAYYPFMLFVPRQDWTTKRESYLSLFRSLRFGPRREAS
jgi:hypothetical protein